MTGPHDSHLPRRTVAYAAVFAMGGILALGSPLTASAHNSLAGSTPEAGSTLTQLPTDFSITTDDDLLDLGGSNAGFALQVIGSDGRYYGDGCLSIAGPSMSTPAAIGPAGAYTVRWQVVSTDGHPLSDEFDFTWAPADASTPAAAGSATPPVCGESGAGAPETTDASAAPPVEPSTTANATPDATSTPEATAVSADEFPIALWITTGVIMLAVAAAGAVALVRRRGRP